MDFDEFDEVLDSEVGERHHAIVAHPKDPYHALQSRLYNQARETFFRGKLKERNEGLVFNVEIGSKID